MTGEASSLTALVLATVLAWDAATPASASPSVAEHFGNIIFCDDAGFCKALAADHLSGYPTLSPDGRTVAWIHIDSLTARGDPQAPGQSSLWIADAKTGAARRYDGGSSEDVRSDIVNPSAVASSLDGNLLYVTSAMAATSPGVHEVNIGTDQRRFITAGALARIVSSGPYRGYLIVGQHRYFDPPKLGSYDAAFLVRPTDGTSVLMIPGSDDFENRSAIADWLKTNGWSAQSATSPP